MPDLQPALQIPDAPILAVGQSTAAVLTPDGESDLIDLADAAKRFGRGEPAVVCHGPATAARLGIDRRPWFDLLELFAFARPAAFCVPTPQGLAAACGVPPGDGLEAAPLALRRAMIALLEGLARDAADPHLRRIAWSMAQAGWSWGVSVLSALGTDRETGADRAGTAGLDVWHRLPESEDQAPPPPPGNAGVEPAEARLRLGALLGGDAEARPSQADYASAVSAAFVPPDDEDAPLVVLAEAGTGVGKTLGYIAPASVWSEKNEAPVWLSTFTRNLQHQIDDELDRLYPDARVKHDRVVLRKGRENYLCLLNFEEAVGRSRTTPADAVALGLMARWLDRTRSGDLSGGDFPSWLPDLMGRAPTLGLSDHRGECIYSACSHYGRCFIENSVRKARRASLVVANHALVMVQSARGTLDPSGRVARFVFDEGHHVFDAADGAFSAHLTGWETAELRRWLRGPETRRRGRGLKERLGDLIDGDETATGLLEETLRAAAALPAAGWASRLRDGAGNGPTEIFLGLVRQQVYARAPGRDGPFDLEVETGDPVPGLAEAADALGDALARLAEPIKALRRRLAKRLDEDADSLDTATRNRLDALARSLQHRAHDPLTAWRAMLSALAAGAPAEFADWFQVSRIDGRDLDVGLHRHWIDPGRPFAEVMGARVQGMVVTSATLTDGSGDVEADWQAAERRTGAVHFAHPAIRARVPSPFDYGEQTRVFIVGDVRKDDLDQVAAAYRTLFLAAGGGALGLFTAIGRLRAVHRRLAAGLEQAGLPLYAQHVDALNLPTLIDIFRAETDSCLLGTDAVRDGVDVPGRSLRLIVFDRVPWPRPTILHKRRRDAFGGRAYDDMLTRLRLKQAYGRLIRRADDRGVFVLLDPMMPSRLLGAFPEGVTADRVGLAEAVAETGRFLAQIRSAQAPAPAEASGAEFDTRP